MPNPLETIPFLLFALEVALVTPVWSQIQTRAPATECHRVVKIDGIAVKQKTIDGRTGQAEFYLEGEIGGRATGRIVLVLESGTGNSVETERTELNVSQGILQYSQSDWDFNMWGTASVQTSAGSSSRPFSSRLRLARDPAAAPPCPASSLQEAAQPYVIGALWNGKTTTWVIDGSMTCALRNNEFVCSDLTARSATTAKPTRQANLPSKWYVVRVSNAASLAALSNDLQRSGSLIVTVDGKSDLVRQYFNPKEIAIVKKVPWKASAATLPLQFQTSDGSTVRIVLRNAVLEKTAGSSTAPVAIEEITITYEGFELR